MKSEKRIPKFYFQPFPVGLKIGKNKHRVVLTIWAEHILSVATLLHICHLDGYLTWFGITFGLYPSLWTPQGVKTSRGTRCRLGRKHSPQNWPSLRRAVTGKWHHHCPYLTDCGPHSCNTRTVYLDGKI